MTCSCVRYSAVNQSEACSRSRDCRARCRRLATRLSTNTYRMKKCRLHAAATCVRTLRHNAERSCRPDAIADVTPRMRTSVIRRRHTRSSSSSTTSSCCCDDDVIVTSTTAVFESTLYVGRMSPPEVGFGLSTHDAYDSNGIGCDMSSDWLSDRHVPAEV